MILRRVIDHFRKQEWTAILLDFLIVVIGVFIGFQVNELNMRRQDGVRDQAALALLMVDLDQMIRLAEADLDSVGANIAALSEAAKLLPGCEADDAERRRLTAIMFQARVERRINVQSAGLDAVSDAGAMSRFKNPEFAKAIGRIYEVADYTRATEATYAAEHDAAYARIWSLMRVSGPVSMIEEGGVYALGDEADYLAPFDVEAYCGSEDAARALVELLDYFIDKQSAFLSWKKSLLNAKEIAKGLVK